MEPTQQPPEVNQDLQPQEFTMHEPKSMPIGSAFSWIRDGFEHFNRDAGVWIGICIVGFIIMMAVSFVPLLSSLMNLTSYIWVVGLLMACKAQDDGQPIDLGYLFAGFKNKPLQMLGMAALFYLAMGVIVYLVVGDAVQGLALAQDPNADPEMVMQQLAPLLDKLPIILLFSIPMIMATWFTPALVAFNNVPLLQAMKLSFIASSRNLIPLVICAVIMTLLFVIGSIPFMLGLLVVMPTFYGVMYHSYKEIFIS